MLAPKVSIITPSYNSAKFIEDTLKSVQAQDYPNLEHIVMDGGSTDDTLQILKRYQGTYNLIWRSEPDRGQSHAYNKAIQIATGDWFLFLNSDDYLLSETSISQVVDAIRKVGEFSIYMGHVHVVDISGNFMRQTKHGGYSQLSYSILLDEFPLCIHQATFTHSQVFEKVGGFNERFYFHMDYEFLVRASKYFDVCLLDLPVSAFRAHAEMKTKNPDYRSPIELTLARFLNGGSLFHKSTYKTLKSLVRHSLAGLKSKFIHRD